MEWNKGRAQYRTTETERHKKCLPCEYGRNYSMCIQYQKSKKSNTWKISYLV